MTRLEAGALDVRRSWHSMEEIVGAALNRITSLAGGRAIRVDVPVDLPLIAIDDVLIEQVIFNLVENALKHAPSAGPIEVIARHVPDGIEVAVADRGPGLVPGSEEQVFEKFYRGEPTPLAGGVGLGLPICRGIVEAHGGRIRAENRPGGGAVFTFRLPHGGEPPTVEPELEDAEGIRPTVAGDG
jgi:two-component system sensor histidine kinase KdpD